MCFYWKNIAYASKKRELTLTEYEKISKNFRYLFYLSISGGEPMLRDDISNIVYVFYKNSGISFVNIATNGSFPKKTYDAVKNILERCQGINVKISLSLDDIGTGHDKIRGVKGLFKKVKKTYELLSTIKNKNFAINIATTFSGLNKDNIYTIIDYISDNFRVNNHTITYIRGDARDKKTKRVTPKDYFAVWNYTLNKYQNKNKGFFRVFNNLIRIMYEINQQTLETNKMIMPCLAGKKFITIDEEGNVYPCEIISYIYKNKSFNMGNLRNFDYSIKEILQRGKTKKIISFIRNSNCCCSFECATLCNIAFSKTNILRLLKK